MKANMWVKLSRKKIQENRTNTRTNVQCTYGVWNDKYNITGDEPNDQDLYNILIDKNPDKYRYIIMSSAYEEYFGKNTLCRIFQTQKRPYVMAFGHHYIWPSMSI
jgi:hypothetical protein